jgi:hypothetical protein
MEEVKLSPKELKLSTGSNPAIRTGKTIKILTECGSLYVVINGNPPVQMFAYLGKSGGCLSCWVDSTTRLIAELLQTGSSVYKVVKILKGFRCPSPHLYPEKERVLSCADALGCALEEYCRMIGREDLLSKPKDSKVKVDVQVRKPGILDVQIRGGSYEEVKGHCKTCGS